MSFHDEGAVCNLSYSLKFSCAMKASNSNDCYKQLRFYLTSWQFLYVSGKLKFFFSERF